MPVRGEVPKCALACNYCRDKKSKCSGQVPCSNCLAHQQVCEFPATMARHRKRKAKEALLEDRLGRLEALLNRQSDCSSPYDKDLDRDTVESQRRPLRTYSESHVQRPGDVRFNEEPRMWQAEQVSQSRSLAVERAPVVPLPSPANTSIDMCLPDLPLASQLPQQSIPPTDRQIVSTDPVRHQYNPQQWRVPDSRAQSPPRIWQQDQLGATKTSNSVNNRPALGRQVNRSFFEEAPDDIIEEKNYPEHHGIFSYLSICSKSSVDWISAQTRTSDFLPIARSLALRVATTLKLKQGLEATRAPDPDYETAQNWSTAFFKASAESLFPTLPRLSFEQRLRDHYLGARTGNEDTGWYALRNIVFATGYQSLLSDTIHKDTFGTAHTESWRYFQNALSVNTELMYMKQDITALQALFLMSMYCEGIGSPALEYGLLSTASRLAQSKGFHMMQQRSSSRLTNEEHSGRVWLWWAIYVFEKHVAARSDRPSVICDEDVSCQLPTSVPPGVSADLNFFLGAIKHAQLSSLIRQRLSSTQLSQQSVIERVGVVREMEQQLESWRATLEPIYLGRPSLKALHNRSNLSINHSIYLYFAYHGSVCAIHSIFSCPWNTDFSQHSQPSELMEQIQKSSAKTIESSREISMVLQQIEINVGTPTWLVFYFPMVSLIKLLIHILNNVTAASVPSDLSLMEVIAGHFSRLEYVSGGAVVITFPREVVNFVRNTVCAPQPDGVSGQYQQRTFAGIGDATNAGFLDTQLPSYNADQYLNLDDMDFLLEELPVFMPSR